MVCPRGEFPPELMLGTRYKPSTLYKPLGPHEPGCEIKNKSGLPLGCCELLNSWQLEIKFMIKIRFSDLKK